MHFFISLIALIALTVVAANPQLSTSPTCESECNDVFATCDNTSGTDTGLEDYGEQIACDTIFAQCNSNCNTGTVEPLPFEPLAAEPETTEPGTVGTA